jgi:hypothetical protein
MTELPGRRGQREAPDVREGPERIRLVFAREDWNLDQLAQLLKALSDLHGLAVESIWARQTGNVGEPPLGEEGRG